MNTRNSARGLKNSSINRGRGSSASRNNISIDLQSSPKPKVVHSPVRRPSIPHLERAQSSTSLTSANIFQDTVAMDNQHSLSQHHLVQASEEIPSRSSLNPNVDPFVQSYVPSNSNPLVPNTNTVNSNNASSFDSLFASMEQTMRNTQEEFRKELTSIRESISRIGSAPTVASSRPPESFHGFPNANTLNSNILSDQSGSSGTNLKLEKWKISFDGTTSVSDFIF